jgi:hypothetical protein
MKTTFLQTTLEPELLAGLWEYAKQNGVSPSVAVRVMIAGVVAATGVDLAKSEWGESYLRWKKRRAKLDGTSPSLLIRVDPEMKAAWDHLCAEKGIKSPKMLRNLVAHFVHVRGINTAELPIPKTRERKSRRVLVSVSDEELATLKARSKDYGGVSKLLAALARAHIYREQPQFSEPELNELAQTREQLFRLANNINQIAKAINTEKKHNSEFNLDADELRRELKVLTAALEADRNNIGALRDATIVRMRGE